MPIIPRIFRNVVAGAVANFMITGTLPPEPLDQKQFKQILIGLMLFIYFHNRGNRDMKHFVMGSMIMATLQYVAYEMIGREELNASQRSYHP